MGRFSFVAVATVCVLAAASKVRYLIYFLCFRQSLTAQARVESTRAQARVESTSTSREHMYESKANMTIRDVTFGLREQGPFSKVRWRNSVNAGSRACSFEATAALWFDSANCYIFYFVLRFERGEKSDNSSNPSPSAIGPYTTLHFQLDGCGEPITFVPTIYRPRPNKKPDCAPSRFPTNQ